MFSRYCVSVCDGNTIDQFKGIAYGETVSDMVAELEDYYEEFETVEIKPLNDVDDLTRTIMPSEDWPALDKIL